MQSIGKMKAKNTLFAYAHTYINKLSAKKKFGNEK